MGSLRPTSISDAALLQRLDSLSSNSEPSSPTYQADVILNTDAHAPKLSVITTPTKPPSLRVNNTDYKNNKDNKSFSGFPNGGIGTLSETIKQAEINTNNSHIGGHKICCRVVSDLILLICVGLPVLAFRLWGASKKRGFFCGDKSLKHPFVKNTVSNWMLFFMCLIVPISIIITVEFFVSHYNITHGLSKVNHIRYYIGRLKIADWIVESYKKIGLLVFGSGVGQLTMDIAKYSIGRLRPHFFAVCQPVMADGSTCDDTFNAGRYIEDFICIGKASPRMFKQMSLSFPSAHASFATFTMIYMAIYLQKRMTWERCKMVKHFIQFTLLMFAWFTGLTRISDYQHHTTDVLAGSAIGALYAIVLTQTMW
uniref:Putative phosphatidate phosphatase n=1 Tax=Ceratitis capitata TaxID=7213 RepID=W8BRP6_CERCA